MTGDQSVDSTTYYSIADVKNIDDLLYTKDNTDHIVKYQKTVEITGIVGETVINSALFKFELINKSDMIIQVLIWNKEVYETYRKQLVSGNVVHIDGAFSKEKHTSLSNSTIPYDLVIGTNTVVHLLKEGPSYSVQDSPMKIPLTTIENSTGYSKLIQIVAYIKQKIAPTSLPNNNKINAGCITDCEKYKLEVRMPSLCDMSEFPVGSHVRVTGTMKYSAHPYLWVLKKEDVQIESDEKKKLFELVKANTILKKKLHDTTNVACKKPRFGN